MNKKYLLDVMESIIYEIDIESYGVLFCRRDGVSTQDSKKFYRFMAQVLGIMLWGKSDRFDMIERLGKKAQVHLRAQMEEWLVLKMKLKEKLAVTIENGMISLSLHQMLDRLEKGFEYFAKGFSQSLLQQLQYTLKMAAGENRLLEVFAEYLIHLSIEERRENGVDEILFAEWVETLEAQMLLFAAKKERHLFLIEMENTFQKLCDDTKSLKLMLVKGIYVGVVFKLNEFYKNFLLLSKLYSSLMIYYEKDMYNNFLAFILYKSSFEKEIIDYYFVNIAIDWVDFSISFTKEKFEKRVKAFFLEVGLDVVVFVNEQMHIVVRIPQTVSEKQGHERVEETIESIFKSFETLMANHFKAHVCAIYLKDLKAVNIDHFKEILRLLHRQRQKDFLQILKDGQLKKIRNKAVKNINLRYSIVEKISQNKILLYAQPIVDQEGAIVFVELLSRLEQHRGGFEQIAEVFKSDAALALRFDIHFLDQLQKYLDKMRGKKMKFSFNIFPTSLENDVFLEKLIIVNKEAKEKKINLTVEITEYNVVKNDRMVKKLHQEHAISFAIDDFGTGYSNFSQFVKFHNEKVLDFIKIDGSLLEMYREKGYFIKALIHFMDQARLSPIVVEKVDTQEKLDFLQALRSPLLYQGFYFYKAEPFETMIQRV